MEKKHVYKIFRERPKQEPKKFPEEKKKYFSKKTILAFVLLAIAPILWSITIKQGQYLKASREKFQETISEEKTAIESIKSAKARVDKLLLVAVLDIGQGDSIVIRTPDNKVILIDGGPFYDPHIHGNAGREVVIPFLKKIGAEKIDMVVLTHSDADHLGGLLSALKGIPVGTVLDQVIPKFTDLYDEYLDTLDKKDIKYVAATSGQVLNWGDMVYAQVLWPEVPVAKRKNLSNVNLQSIVIKMVYGDVSFLFTGDIEKAAEKELLVYRGGLKSTFLKSPHHGSKTSSLGSFLREVDPDVVLVSAGVGNKFGHPSPEVIKRYNKEGCEIYRTDLNGTILVYTNGIECQILTERKKGSS